MAKKKKTEFVKPKRKYVRKQKLVPSEGQTPKTPSLELSNDVASELYNLFVGKMKLLIMSDVMLTGSKNSAEIMRHLNIIEEGISDLIKNLD